MQGDDGLSRARRTGNPRGTAVIPLHQLPLGRMEKDRPLLPGIVQGALQFLDVVHHPETPLGIGMGKGIGNVFRLRLGRDGQFCAAMSAATAGLFPSPGKAAPPPLPPAGGRPDSAGCPRRPGEHPPATRRARRISGGPRSQRRRTRAVWEEAPLFRRHIAGRAISCTVSRISTNCAAPVCGCVSSFRRSAQR